MANYMPEVKLRVEDLEETTKRIQEDLRLRLEKNIERVDSAFAIENYDYITQELENPKLREIYKLMGPFDFFQFKALETDQEDESAHLDSEDGNKRDLQVHFEKRRSGANYRGEVSTSSGRPDGMGFKVFHKRSVYEGYFKNGMCHGQGRGITSKGEVYQGQFIDDQIDG